ncbi:MAG: hypothetical protein LC790_12705, partial [Actinobacteria bacterium]|nr:hypothetical protein [Actinomycetota bacterium]
MHEQLAQQPGVELVGLRAPLAILTLASLSRLGQTHLNAGASALFDDKPPAGHRLNRDDRLLRRQRREERTDRRAVGRADPAGLHLPAV